jgi:hypothetical protein
MSHICSDPVLAEQLGSLADEFLEAAADRDATAAHVEHDRWKGRRRAHG